MTDWLPTLQSATNSPGDTLQAPLDGVDQFMALRSPSDFVPPRQEVHSVTKFGEGMLRIGDYKLIRGFTCMGRAIDQTQDFATMCSNSVGVPLDVCETEGDEDLEDEKEAENEAAEEETSTFDITKEGTLFVFNIKVTNLYILQIMN